MRVAYREKYIFTYGGIVREGEGKNKKKWQEEKERKKEKERKGKRSGKLIERCFILVIDKNR